ncbi:hypothetical protein KR222_006613 [Zaprionus bogoriensis]|nr:hypothetical protein KR222_006613 [Zaprionus bogoriensis]
MASITERGLVLSGYQKKLKTMKKKFFALYKDTSTAPARLEYYDTEKKFSLMTEPKRVIYLQDCFNINRRFDTKHNYVLALSSREGGFGIVFNSETDLRKWLDNLLSIQRDNANRMEEAYNPYEFVWQVLVQKKGLAENYGITGKYHCCLTSKSLTFICIGPEKSQNGEIRVVRVEILLTTIRRCGHASPQSIFYMELGRQSVLGSGELWMETEDAAIAKNMHDTILGAMSAKTESNMNIYNEPMRKRSSSATEASKPINVLQKRQNPIEIRNSFSPQYNSYGRERCDSLPTRNRTLSECSNQTYNALKHGQRCNTISGSRPYSTHKHSDSPPINTPMKCSESEESSISIDEADDKGMFEPYRISSRTTKGIIPEENIEDFVADNSKFSHTNDNFENYISMTPMNSINENLNANHLTNNIGSKNLLNVADVDKLNIDFPEHSSEKLAKNSDSYNQCERPTRAYSIGSKVEHIKMSQILGNLNEVNNSSPRVRAYSVGSKSKIPRCDIQRGVLFTKVKKGYNHKGSNCNVSMDAHVCNEAIGYNNPREVKSTSAPLLNLRHYMNSDRMSDLMEIDFSVGTPSSTTSQEQKTFNNFEMAAPTQKHISSPNFCSNGNIKHTEMLKQDESPNTQNSDSGYLEMKPVGKSSVNSKPASLEDKMRTLKLHSIAGLQQQIPQDEPVNNCKLSYVASKMNSIQGISLEKQIRQIAADTTSADVKSDNSIESSKPHNITDLHLASADKQNCSQLKVDEYVNLEIDKLENAPYNIALDISNAVGRKLIHSLSNEDYSKYYIKSSDAAAAADAEDVGYQILQIKSDSSLIAKKKCPRPTYAPQLGRKTQLEDANNLDEKSTSKSTTTKINLSLQKSEAIANNKDAAKPDAAVKDETASTSGGVCDHELHYASLDLPQSSGPTTLKALNKVSCESPPVEVSLESRNSYAKIDFDQSDSSSASSKVCNV